MATSAGWTTAASNALNSSSLKGKQVNIATPLGCTVRQPWLVGSKAPIGLSGTKTATRGKFSSQFLIEADFSQGFINCSY